MFNKKLFTIIIAACWTASYAGDPPQVSVQTIYAQAPSYESHMATVQGVVSELHINSPIQAPGFKCVVPSGQATFVLDDGTGSLPIEVLGSCLPQKTINALPQNGDLVRVIAVIHLLNTDLPARLRGVAASIQILDPK
jgi:hypothetical protein